MKRILLITSIIAMCLIMMLPMTVSAASASGSFTGPETVRAGDTITLTFSLKGSGLYGAAGTLSYDSSQVTLTGTKQKIASPWLVEFNANAFVAYDNNLSDPINGNTALFTVTFKVKQLEPGTSIKISCTDVVATDGAADAKVEAVSYTATVAAPKSKDNTLASLTVSNATLSPAFSEDVTSYTATVPFSVEKLDVKASAKDGKAKVSVNSPKLTANAITDVTITVTAESGAKKTYVIAVTREQDPNYVPSRNNDLIGIAVEGFLLSPLFSTDVTEYVVWLPYETENVIVSGTAADEKATVRVEGGNDLVAGADNEVRVICVAEDGTEKVYTVIVKRAAPHGEGSEETAETEEVAETTVETVETIETTETLETNETVETAETEDTEQIEEIGDKQGGVPIWLVIVVGLAALAIGGVVGFFFGKKKK